MDTLGLMLQEAGVIRVTSEEEAENTNFDITLPHREALSNPRDRFNHYDNILQSWNDKTTILQEPGRSFCDACKDIDIDTLCTAEGYIHSECYWALLASAEVSKCPMCFLMVNALRTGSHRDFDIAVKLLDPFRNDYQVCLRAVPRKERIERDSLEVVILNAEPCMQPGRLIIYTAPGTIATTHGFSPQLPLNSEQKLAVLDTWLHGQHDLSECAYKTDALPQNRKDTGTHSLPTRLIDVSSFSNSSDEDCCLVESQSFLPKPVNYIALSYRWGKNNTLTTTKNTLKSRLRRIAYNELTRTVRDAVVITRRLKLRYLWVDALCIVQDDKSEWLQEAGKMGEIYMNSYCTIAAHSAQTEEHGFLLQSLARPMMVQLGRCCKGPHESAQQPKVIECEIITLPEKSSIDPFSIAAEKGYPTPSAHFWVSQGSNVRQHIDNSKLSCRAWALQELTLSQRIIHFAEDGAIYFESAAGLQHVEGTRLHLFRSPGLKTALQPLISSDENFEDSGPSSRAAHTKVYHDWYEIVERYSRRSLTVADDKLPALTGIIHRVHTFTKDKCYMGIWSQRVPQCLLWLRAKETLKLHGSYRAPSWSWAAYDGEVQYPMWDSKRDDTHIRKEFVQADFIPEIRADERTAVGILAGPTGLVMRGVKMVRDIAFPIGHMNAGTGLRFMDGQIGKPAWIQFCNWESLPVETRFWSVCDDSGKLVGWASLDRDERDNIDGEKDQITCIAIASHADDKPENGFVRGFLVLLVQYLRNGAWVRVGMGQVTDTGLFSNVASRLIIV